MHSFPEYSLKPLTRRPLGRLAASSLLISILGCAGGPAAPLMTWRVDDPPQLSPYARALSPQTPGGTTQNVGRPPQTEPTDSGVSDEPLTTVTPRPTPKEQPDQPAEQPPSHADADDASAIPQDQPLLVTIESPKAVNRGDNVTFNITVRNNKQELLEGVIVTCHLPDGLVFPDAPQRAFRQRLGRLESDQQQTLDLTLRCESFGNHCVEFDVTADDLKEVVSKSACLDCPPPTAALPLTPLELIGPTERTVGARAEFVLTLLNLTGVEQPDVHVMLQHEGLLEPREASAGSVRRPGQLTWDLGLLRVDERVQIQVEFECLSTTDQTCVTASVSGKDLKAGPVQSCLTTIPRSTIDLDIVDQRDPVTIGEKVAYVVRVTNTSLQPLSNMLVQLQADGLQPVGVTVGDEQSSAGIAFDRESGLITVPLQEQFSPDATQTITLQALATRSGAGNLNAIVADRNRSLFFSTAEPTVINPLGSSIARDDR